MEKKRERGRKGARHSPRGRRGVFCYLELMCARGRAHAKQPGDHMIVGNDAYGGTFRLIDTVFGQWGVEYSVVDTADAQAIAGALRPNTGPIGPENCLAKARP